MLHYSCSAPTVGKACQIVLKKYIIVFFYSKNPIIIPENGNITFSYYSNCKQVKYIATA